MKNKYIRAHLKVARIYGELSTADRLKVGCIIVKDDRIISIGYNGMPSGGSNVCEKDGESKPEVLHAEANAITKLASLHLVTNNDSEKRVLRLGEEKNRIINMEAHAA